MRKKFRERNLVATAAVTAVVLVAAAVLALNAGKLGQRTYSAYLASAVGLTSGDVVTVAGVRVGAVSGLSLHGDAAKVTFTVSSGRHLGRETALEVKVLNPVGVEYLELVPAGSGSLSGPIPESRTVLPGTLVADLNQLSAQTEQIDIPQLVQALRVLTRTVAAISPAQTRAALAGVAQLSAVLARRQNELETLVTQADQLTGLLAARKGRLSDLVRQSSLLLKVLDQRRAAINTLLQTTSQMTSQIDHIISGDRSVLDPLLSNLNAVSGYLATDSANLDEALPLLAAFTRYVSNATGSGPYADFVAPALVLPDSLLARCAATGVSSAAVGCRP